MKSKKNNILSENMEYNRRYWNKTYKKLKENKPTYDLWLDKYKDILDEAKRHYIIDLGCGNGGDTLYLTERKHKVIACDYSEEALKAINKFLPEVETIRMDISKTLPFENESAKLIIADLSLHYFNTETTKEIIKEIKRVLKSDGYLIGRVNSIKDINYGARSGQEIEKNFYLTEEGYKRFFSEEDIRFYFKEFVIEVCEEKSVLKYGSEKRVFEFMIRK